MTNPAIPGYKIVTRRGSGAFGTVWKGIWGDGFECAVKVLTPGMWHPQYLSWCLERLRQEAERTDLVKVYSYDLTKSPPHVSMALMPEGTMTLEQLAGRLPVREAWALLEQLAGTVAWLHSEGVVHTGLSSGNVFAGSGPGGEPVVLLSDIGQGWLTEAPVAHLHSQIAYIAPEHWRAATKFLQEGRAHSRDVYAFGVVAWRLLTGGWPRAAKVFDAIAASHAEELNLQPVSFADWLEKEDDARWPAEPESDEEAARRKVVEQCLKMDPAERFPDMKAMLEALNLCALLPPVAAAPGERGAGEMATDANGDGEVNSADAFVEGAPAPRRRRFFLRLPRLSRTLQENRGESRPLWRTLLGPGTAAVALLGLAGVAAWALKERSGRITARNDLAAARSANDELSSRLPKAESDAANALSEARAARAGQTSAALHDSVELIGKVLATQPVEDDELPAWRTAVRAVAGQCAGILENAPADAAGMEALWQFARLKTALGEEDGALPVLEKLTRDLEAAAIAAAGEFPVELIRLTGRVESLTGKILSSRRRIEDAMPHLRRASDSFEKWLASNGNDTDTARDLAHNLLLEGRALGERGQPDQARSVLMKIDSLIGKPDDSTFRQEDYFLLADEQFALGRLDALQIKPAPPKDPGEKEALNRQLEAAITRHSDGVKLLLPYDNANKKSIPCRTRMAHGYFEIGRLLTRTDDVREASVAFGESVKIYTELIGEDPENAAWKLELSSVYNDAAQLIRTTKPGVAGAAEALDYQNFSVDFLSSLNRSTPLDNRVRLLLASSLTLNGELLQQSGDTVSALKRMTEAITLTAELLAENTLAESERREARRTSARAWTGTAGLHEKAGPKHREDTVDALNRALAEWEASPVEDPSDEVLFAWVKDKLSKIK